MSGWMDRSMDGWMDEWVDGQMDGWMDGWMDRQMHTSVFDKLIWRTIGPKSFLFSTAQFTLWDSGAVNYDYILTNSINSVQIVFPKAPTLTIVASQIGPCFKSYQNL